MKNSVRQRRRNGKRARVRSLGQTIDVIEFFRKSVDSAVVWWIQPRHRRLLWPAVLFSSSFCPRSASIFKGDPEIANWLIMTPGSYQRPGHAPRPPYSLFLPPRPLRGSLIPAGRPANLLFFSSVVLEIGWKDYPWKDAMLTMATFRRISPSLLTASRLCHLSRNCWNSGRHLIRKLMSPCVSQLGERGYFSNFSKGKWKKVINNEFCCMSREYYVTSSIVNFHASTFILECWT